MSCIKIEKAENGFILEYDDPAIVAANQKSDSRWQDPEMHQVFLDEASLLDGVKALLPGLTPTEDQTDDFESAFSDQSE